MLSSVGFRLVAAVSFTGAVARTGALFASVPIVGATRLDLSATQIGMSMALGSLAGVLVTYPAGMMVDYFGRKAVIVPTTIASGLSFLVYGLAPSFPWFVTASVVWGVASAMSGAAPAAYAADVAPQAHAATGMRPYRT